MSGLCLSCPQGRAVRGPQQLGCRNLGMKLMKSQPYNLKTVTGDGPGDSQVSFHGQAAMKGGLEECCSHGCCGRGRSAALISLIAPVPARECRCASGCWGINVGLGASWAVLGAAGRDARPCSEHGELCPGRLPEL